MHPLRIFPLFPVISATPLGRKVESGASLPSHVVYQFPDSPSWIENIAVRQNGDLLLTMLSTPELFLLRNPRTKSPELKLVHSFDTLTGLLGIAETTPDVFITAGGNFSNIAVPTPGTSSVWEVDLRGKKPKVYKVVDIPEAVFVNGMTTLPWDKNSVLVADSTLGKIFKVNIRAKTYEVAIDVPEMHMGPDAVVPIGINGITIYKGYLYWTNSYYRKVYKLKINKTGGIAAGATVQTVGSPDVGFLDDFALDNKGDVWATTNAANELLVVSPKGKVVVALGSSTELTVAGDTAAAFGRTKGDEKTLYVVTDGALAGPVNGTITEAGKIVAVDTRNFSF
ncbi:hypothetical protein EDB80DRAFT_808431 [Ilyonectria destructans]|nr:hypothetical protein EDB80DRAFT_808431 [Ilyonectria destructans]